MTPRKETEPTKEHIEEAKVLSLYSGLKDRSEARKKIALWLARRDEARDAEVVRPWREALRLMWDKWENGDPCFEGGEASQGASLGNAFKLSDDEYDSILALLVSPSPASSEPCQGIKNGLRCSPCVNAKRTCQPEGLP